jgi:hypothetical protein
MEIAYVVQEKETYASQEISYVSQVSLIDDVQENVNDDVQESSSCASLVRDDMETLIFAYNKMTSVLKEIEIFEVNIFDEVSKSVFAFQVTWICSLTWNSSENWNVIG